MIFQVQRQLDISTLHIIIFCNIPWSGKSSFCRSNLSLTMVQMKETWRSIIICITLLF